MNRSRRLSLLLLLGSAFPPLAAQDPNRQDPNQQDPNQQDPNQQDPGQREQGQPERATRAPEFRTAKTVEQLLIAMRAAERAHDRVAMRIETTGRLPNDAGQFRSTGTLRVLGKTHFHVKMHWSFGEDQEGETETVRTEQGLWMRENDPVQGQVFTHMDAALMALVESASAALGEASLAGPGAAQAESPLGSRMIADLAASFALTLDGPRAIDGMDVLVVGGPRKATTEDDLLAPEADHVDVLVRVSDGAVVRMTQLRKGEPISEVRVPELDLVTPLDPASFVLTPPEGVAFVDVLDHPPARAQIERLFEDAKLKGWKRPGEGEAAPEAKKQAAPAAR